jgi:hypothetical protein
MEYWHGSSPPSGMRSLAGRRTWAVLSPRLGSGTQPVNEYWPVAAAHSRSIAIRLMHSEGASGVRTIEYPIPNTSPTIWPDGEQPGRSPAKLSAWSSGHEFYIGGRPSRKVGTFTGAVAPILHLLRAVQDTPFPISDLVKYHVMRNKLTPTE